jgi:alginate O-acetyltransferase complex protein AlgI
MAFTSWKFVLFLAVVLLALWIARTRRSRQMTVLISSVIFYMSWKPAYILLLAAPSVIDYWCAIKISETEDARVRRRFLWLSVVSNIGLLFYFKYTNFFLHTIGALLGRQIPIFEITLPVGISFFTFKALSYTIDVYRKEIPVCRDWWGYTMFITYFPELVAGPIVRASVFLPQMTRSLKPSRARMILGLQIMLLGFTKKLLIADRLAVFSDVFFSKPQEFSPVSALIGVLCYTLQIYCDFSGYSDIAIGVSKIIGFDLPENFNMPYLSLSLTEFWRRWHITLSTWLRDYLYIPLGGNRHGKWRTYVNLMLTMLLGGLWHGANATFIVWGLLHGLGLASERMAGIGAKNSARGPIMIVFAWLRTFAFVCLTWIFFRAPDFATAAVVLKKVLWLDKSGAVYYYTPFFMLLPLVVLGHWLGSLAMSEDTQTRWIAPSNPLKAFYDRRFGVRPHPLGGIYVLFPPHPFAMSFLLSTWLMVIYYFAPITSSPFIYFQF